MENLGESGRREKIKNKKPIEQSVAEQQRKLYQIVQLIN